MKSNITFVPGGLDSSLIAGLVVQCAQDEGIAYPIQTFSIGMEGSPDLQSARRVCITV